MKYPLFSIILFLNLFGGHTGAQDISILQQLSEEDQQAIEAIAVYPAKEREAILLASLHPEILVRMESIRNVTESKFKTSIASLTKEDQQRIYNLSRYPELVTVMCDEGKVKSRNEMNDLLQRFPEDIHSDAIYVNQNHFALLCEVHQLYASADNSFNTLLSSYPDNIREAYNQLNVLPAVMSLLTNNMKMTVLIGDLYARQPQQLINHLDSLSVVVAEQQAREVEDWKKKLEEDPEAMKEYETAAREFTGDYPYDDDVYEGPQRDRYTERVVVHEVWRPYSYWFGWPSWYVEECWYPYPWWYHSGFYYGPGHVIVIIGMPSPLFFNWHFHHDHHFYHYPHFTDHIFSHYYGPRHIGKHVQPVLTKWQQDNRSELPANWFDDDKYRVDRIREYGKFKMDYEKEVGVKTEKSPSQRDFLKKHADRYPTLKPVLTEQTESPGKPQRVDKENRPEPLYRPEQNKPVDKVKREERTDRPKEKPKNVRENQQKPPREKSPQTPPVKKEQQKDPPRTDPAKPEKKQPTPRTPPK